tara:strand:+ start:342 stop:1049 length:708 start_codon:yes stop_codon:yes gene_type:complete
MIDKDQDWVEKNTYSKLRGSISPPSFPHEYLVKTLSSSFNTGLKPFTNNNDKTVLEIGSFGANNIRFLWERGYQKIYGIEITDSLVNLCRKNLHVFTEGKIPEKNIVLGSNLELPFEDNFFDLIISVNTIHYSTGIEIKEALSLWRQKLKDNGRIYIETAGPQHDFVLNSIRIDENEWKWGDKSGFREGKPAGFFDSEEHWSRILSSVFSKVSIGRITEKSEYNTVDFMTALCIK